MLPHKPRHVTTSVLLVMLSGVAFVLEMYRMTMLHKQLHVVTFVGHATH